VEDKYAKKILPLSNRNFPCQKKIILAVTLFRSTNSLPDQGPPEPIYNTQEMPLSMQAKEHQPLCVCGF